ncbi:hypothetical protein F5J12DRAFT_854882 [Pisolithus orientalis]|uniref:uncharacterized protein n=1 Tax=Pisolithus orientalis TaxID=936130 RepID=UPI002224F5AD|nr:uncharacterized protein F5J12DRAFT_854882 [Pisolithus orientalis]KAI5995760.1 hypothetical protein F5J12DRAFT_854882 [Pisolithus orientalis]
MIRWVKCSGLICTLASAGTNQCTPCPTVVLKLSYCRSSGSDMLRLLSERSVKKISPRLLLEHGTEKRRANRGITDESEGCSQDPLAPQHRHTTPPPIEDAEQRPRNPFRQDTYESNFVCDSTTLLLFVDIMHARLFPDLHRREIRGHDLKECNIHLMFLAFCCSPALSMSWVSTKIARHGLQQGRERAHNISVTILETDTAQGTSAPSVANVVPCDAGPRSIIT